MNDDIYLNLAVDLYNSGTWDKETLVRRVTLYAKEKNIDMNAINAFLDRLTKVKEYTIEDKRKILSVIKLGETELKYGNVVDSMADEIVEKFYKVEEESLGKDRIEKYYEIANNKKASMEEGNQTVVPTVPSKPKELTPKDIKINGNVTLEDVIYGNYTANDLLGITEKDSDEIFNKLVTSVDKKSFNTVVANFRSKLGEDYAKAFIKEWNKVHSDELDKEQENQKKPKNNGLHAPDPIVSEPSMEERVVIPPFAGLNPEAEKGKPTFHAPDPIVSEPSMEERVVMPSFDELNMPETEEEYQEQAKNITSPEKDSSVRKVNISPERLAKLKKTKDKVLNFSIKTAMVIAAFTLINLPSAIILVGGYMYFASEIKCGRFNPKNPIGKAIKNSVEKVMNIGMPKAKKEELEKEGGKTR